MSFIIDKNYNKKRFFNILFSILFIVLIMCNINYSNENLNNIEILDDYYIINGIGENTGAKVVDKKGNVILSSPIDANVKYLYVYDLKNKTKKYFIKRIQNDESAIYELYDLNGKNMGISFEDDNFANMPIYIYNNILYLRDDDGFDCKSIFYDINKKQKLDILEKAYNVKYIEDNNIRVICREIDKIVEYKCDNNLNIIDKNVEYEWQLAKKDDKGVDVFGNEYNWNERKVENEKINNDNDMGYGYYKVENGEYYDVYNVNEDVKLFSIKKDEVHKGNIGMQILKICNRLFLNVRTDENKSGITNNVYDDKFNFLTQVDSSKIGFCGVGDYYFATDDYKTTVYDKNLNVVKILKDLYRTMDMYVYNGNVIYVGSMSGGTERLLNDKLESQFIVEEPFNETLLEKGIILDTSRIDGEENFVNKLYDFNFNLIKRLDDGCGFYCWEKFGKQYYSLTNVKTNKVFIYNENFEKVIEHNGYRVNSIDKYIGINNDGQLYLYDENYNVVKTVENFDCANFSFYNEEKDNCLYDEKYNPSIYQNRFAFGRDIDASNNEKKVGIMKCANENKYRLIDNDGNILSKPYKNLQYLDDKYFVYINGFRWGIVDNTGKELCEHNIFDNFKDDSYKEDYFIYPEYEEEYY